MKLFVSLLVLAVVCGTLEAGKLNQRAAKRHELSRSSQRQLNKEDVERELKARSGSYQIHSNLKNEDVKQARSAIHHEVRSHVHKARISNGVGADKSSTRNLIIAILYDFSANETIYVQGALLPAGFAVTASIAAFLYNNSVSIPLYVITGAYDVSQSDDANLRVYEVTDYAFLYSNDTDAIAAGVLLLNLNTTTYDNDATPIYLPSDNSSCVSQTVATVYGWGKTSNDDKVNATTPKQATVTIQDQNSCKNKLPVEDQKYYDDFWLCTIDTSNGGLCYDDAGAPLELVVNGNTTLIGLGVGRDNCDDNTSPSYFANVCSFSDAIETMQWYFILFGQNGIFYFFG